jgi:glycosyltransferase involved in cell wall biosynthesis
MKYSILVPSYDPEGKNIQTVSRLLESIDRCSKGKDYELIVRKNGKSYVESHNDALRTSRGDYIIILNDDTLIQDEEWLEKLTDDNKIISWRGGVFGARKEPTWDFACWSMSRKTFENVGYFDERFKNGVNFEDNDYAYRAREVGVEYEIRPINMIHYGGLTLNTYYKDAHLQREENHTKFNEKWQEKK